MVRQRTPNRYSALWRGVSAVLAAGTFALSFEWMTARTVHASQSHHTAQTGTSPAIDSGAVAARVARLTAQYRAALQLEARDVAVVEQVNSQLAGMGLPPVSIPGQPPIVSGVSGASALATPTPPPPVQGVTGGS